VDDLWTAEPLSAAALSHNCGQLVDNAVSGMRDTTVTGPDEVHCLWI
jgi:hypothetical protein